MLRLQVHMVMIVNHYFCHSLQPLIKCVTNIYSNFLQKLYSLGWYIMYSCKICAYRSEKNLSTCPVCGSTSSFVDEDISILEQLGCNSLAIYKMQKLKKQDIIEYELKMSQFRTQYEQQQSIRKSQQMLNNTQGQQTSNRPKCPTCGSTNIQKISATRKAMGAIGFGLLSKTARSQFECLDCKCKW